MKNNRLSWILTDINTINPEDYVTGEVLIDSTTGELVFINQDQKPIRYTSSLKKDFSSDLTDHAKSSNAHLLADDAQNGFMSTKNMVSLIEIQEFYNTIKNLNLVDENMINRTIVDGVVSEPVINIVSNNKVTISKFGLVIDKKFITCPKLELTMPTMPTENFKNINEESGLRRDYVYLLITRVEDKYEFELKIITNFNFRKMPNTLTDKEGYKFINFNETPCVFRATENPKTVSDRFIVSLFSLTMYNENLRNAFNPNGKISNDIELDMQFAPIYNKVFHNIILVDTLLHNNIKKYENGELTTFGEIECGKIISYGIQSNEQYNIINVPFNGNDTDLATGTVLSKGVVYSRGISGFKMDSAENEGHYINIKDKLKSEFTLDFVLEENNTRLVSDKIIQFLDKSFRPVINVNVDKGMIFINSSDNENIISANLNESKYLFIKIVYNGRNVSLIMNGKEIINKVHSFNLLDISNVQITATSCKLSNVQLKNKIHINNLFGAEFNKIQLNKAPLFNQTGNKNYMDMKEFDLISFENPPCDFISYRKMRPNIWCKHDQIIIRRNIGEFITGVNGEIPLVLLNKSKINVSFIERGQDTILTILDDIKTSEMDKLQLKYISLYDEKDSSVVSVKNIASVTLNNSILEEIPRKFIEKEKFTFAHNDILINETYDQDKALLFTTNGDNKVRVKIDVKNILRLNNINLEGIINKVIFKGKIASSEKVEICHSNSLIKIEADNRELDLFQIELDILDSEEIEFFISNVSEVNYTNFIALYNLEIQFNTSGSSEDRIFVQYSKDINESAIVRCDNNGINILSNKNASYLCIVTNITKSIDIIDKSYDNIISSIVKRDDMSFFLVSKGKHIKLVVKDKNDIKLYNTYGNPLMLGVES